MWTKIGVGAFVGYLTGAVFSFLTLWALGWYDRVDLILVGTGVGTMVGPFVGVIIHQHQRYKKVINFRRHFWNRMQNQVEECLQGHAFVCNERSKDIISLQRNGSKGFGEGVDFDSVYARVQRNFKLAQEGFYEAYD